MNRFINSMITGVQRGDGGAFDEEYLSGESMRQMTIHDGETHVLKCAGCTYYTLVKHGVVKHTIRSIMIAASAGTFQLKIHREGDATGCRSRIVVGDIIYNTLPIESCEYVIACIVNGRKYNEHRHQLYIAATKWRFKYPADCLVVCRE